MSFSRLAAFGVVALTGLASSALADQDNVTIWGVLDYPENESQYYELEGQNAYVQQRTNGGTSGGQLLGITSNAGFASGYSEIFPEDNLTDYLTFGYFGVIDTHEWIEIGLRADFLDTVVDTSIVMALQPGVGQGQKVEDFNTPGYDEATLVAAFTGSFDSQEFLDVLNSYGDQGEHFGTIGLPQLGVVGDTLDLIAFIGGPNGDEGVKVGELNTQVERVPSPGATALFGLAGLTVIRRRR